MDEMLENENRNGHYVANRTSEHSIRSVDFVIVHTQLGNPSKCVQKCVYEYTSPICQFGDRFAIDF